MVKKILAFVIFILFTVGAYSQTTISDGVLKASVTGTEKIPVSGTGHPVINTNRIFTYMKARMDSIYGSSGVGSVLGTSNRITSSGGANPIIDIDASYVGQSSITTLGTIGTGTWNATVIGAAKGGTGIANNAASTLTISGNFATTLTVSNTTSVTLPTAGTLATLAGAESLTNKKLGSLTSNGFVITSGGDGSLSIDINTYQASGLSYLLASGGTASSSNTYTANTATWFNWTGTWTATANNQYAGQFGGSFTSRTTNLDFLNGYVYNHTMTAGASNTQTIQGVLISPTMVSGSTSSRAAALVVSPTWTEGAGTFNAKYGIISQLSQALSYTGIRIMNTSTGSAVFDMVSLSGGTAGTSAQFYIERKNAANGDTDIANSGTGSISFKPGNVTGVLVLSSRGLTSSNATTANTAIYNHFALSGTLTGDASAGHFVAGSNISHTFVAGAATQNFVENYSQITTATGIATNSGIVSAYWVEGGLTSSVTTGNPIYYGYRYKPTHSITNLTGTFTETSFRSAPSITTTTAGNVTLVGFDHDPTLTVAGTLSHYAFRARLGDISIEDSARGLILKDTAGTPHYWRVTISTIGVLTTTDLGTTLP